MAKVFTITNQEWTKLAPTGSEDSDLVLNTSEFRQVWHSEGSNRNPIILKQLAADPTHPFTAGELIATFSQEDTLHGQRDVVHSSNFEHGLFYDEHQDAGGVIEQGGLYLSTYRIPLEWLAQIYTQTTGGTSKYFLQLNAVRPDRRVIDETEISDGSITIDIDTDDTSTADIALTNGTSTAAVEGGVEMKWELTLAQHTSLKPQDGNGNRTFPKIGLTIASASTVAPITYSAFSELHPTTREGEFQLNLGQDRGLKAPTTGAWYARLRYPNAVGKPDTAYLSVGE